MIEVGSDAVAYLPIDPDGKGDGISQRGRVQFNVAVSCCVSVFFKDSLSHLMDQIFDPLIKAKPCLLILPLDAAMTFFTIAGMKLISLQSGSNGNCFYIETDSVRLLIDAGISARQADLRLAQHGRDIRDVDALLITHDHSDHAKSMGIFQRKFGMPVYITRSTLAASQRFLKVGKMERVRIFSAGDSLSFGDVIVHSIPTPHDSAEGLAYVVQDPQHRVGILTDLGHAFDGLRDVLRSLDAVIIESNYDHRMLRDGGYPQRLKKRISGQGGHLSNDDSASLLKDALQQSGHPRLRWACLCHLSEDNNCPDVAVQTHRDSLGDEFPIYVASRDDVGPIMEL